MIYFGITKQKEILNLDFRSMVSPNGRAAISLGLKTNRTASVPGSKTEVLIDDLAPFTLYNISMTAENQHGTSLPSYYLLVLTQSSEEARKIRQKQLEEKAKEDSSVDEVSFTTPENLPKVPDFKQCCRNIDNTTVHKPYVYYSIYVILGSQHFRKVWRVWFLSSEQIKSPQMDLRLKFSHFEE